MNTTNSHNKLHNTVYRKGSGIPLILIHAFPIDHHMWHDCANELTRLLDEAGYDTPIYAPDMPGAGNSAPLPINNTTNETTFNEQAYAEAFNQVADSYVELLESTGKSQAIWVGLSMGGYVTLNIHKRHPNAVAGLALCDTQATPDSAQARAKRLDIAQQCENNHSVKPAMFFADVHPGDSTVKQSEAFITRFTQLVQEQTPQGIAWRQRMAAARPDLSEQLALITAPATVVCGECDPSSPPELMRSIAQDMKQTEATFHLIKDCGHFSALEHPRKIAQILFTLIQQVVKAHNK